MKSFPMKTTRLIKAFATCALLALSMGTSHAAASYCAPNTVNGAGLSITDVTYDNGTTSATDCFGIVSGNDNAGINGLGLTWGTDWSFLLKDDNPGSNPNGSGSYMGLDFAMSATSGTAGTWSLTGVDTNGVLPLNLPTSLDFVAVLKGSNAYALYFFDDVVFNGANGGTWVMNITAGKKNSIADLSHLSLYIRQGDGDICAFGGCGENEIPEPGMLALLGLGFLSLTLSRRKKQQ